MKDPFHQTFLYEIHSRIFCFENQCQIHEIPASFWQRASVLAANEIWLMGIWEMSPGSRKIAQSHSGLKQEFKKALRDVQEDDILSSPYAVFNYELNPMIASHEGLAQFRTELHRRNKSLILDFVPNHMALDTPLLDSHAQCFVKGDAIDKNHFLHASGQVFAHGRDPYFDGWTDTVQWDFSNPQTIELHAQILLSIAKLCDGVRCDMAMLALPDVFQETHGKMGISYWNEVIGIVKKEYPNFKFYAEAYWNREYELQTLGFDGTYDKTLYDRLSKPDGQSVCDHLKADLSYQNHSIRFIENHDEERAYCHFGEYSKDAFTLLCFLPGVILYYEGQELGNKIKLPVQLGKRDIEIANPSISDFYVRVFQALSKRPKEVFRESLNYQLYCEGQVQTYLITYNGKSELLIWNPMSYEISGKVLLPPNVKINELLHDLTTNATFPKPSPEDIKDGLYFKLASKSAQWFIF
jgi:hypothetical protein